MSYKSVVIYGVQTLQFTCHLNSPTGACEDFTISQVENSHAYDVICHCQFRALVSVGAVGAAAPTDFQED